MCDDPGTSLHMRMAGLFIAHACIRHLLRIVLLCVLYCVVYFVAGSLYVSTSGGSIDQLFALLCCAGVYVELNESS